MTTENTRYCAWCKERFPLTRKDWYYTPKHHAWMHIKCGAVEMIGTK